MTLGILTTRSIEYHYAEYRIFIGMLIIIVLSVIVLSVVMLSV
jgi:hypothetical protein